MRLTKFIIVLSVFLLSSTTMITKSYCANYTDNLIEVMTDETIYARTAEKITLTLQYHNLGPGRLLYMSSQQMLYVVRPVSAQDYGNNPDVLQGNLIKTNSAIYMRQNSSSTIGYIQFPANLLAVGLYEVIVVYNSYDGQIPPQPITQAVSSKIIRIK